MQSYSGGSLSPVSCSPQPGPSDGPDDLSALHYCSRGCGSRSSDSQLVGFPAHLAGPTGMSYRALEAPCSRQQAFQCCGLGSAPGRQQGRLDSLRLPR